MKIRIVLCAFVLLIASTASWSSGQEEGAGSGRGKYLAAQGLIIPREEVRVNSYIASIDYNYPFPEEPIGVHLYTGHRQIVAGGQEEILQIGIQAGKVPFEALPPMNLAFVIDHSGSMAGQDKLEWVKQAFEVFIRQVRDIDFVSLVIFDDRAAVVFPSTRMNSQEKRNRFKRAVDEIAPAGGTNLVAGLKLGYEQVMSNYRKEYTNRVLFLTDGMGTSEGILEMADSYRQMGINVSTIGVGVGFDHELMRELAKSGGGSSRFIANAEEMEKIFGSELDRMVVPTARDLEMELEFLLPVQDIETWGYNHRIAGRKITFSQATLHHGDYETLLVRFILPPLDSVGEVPLFRFQMQYKDLDGKNHRWGSKEIHTNVVEAESQLAGYSNSRVLRAGTMLFFAEGLIRIADVYFAGREELSKINELRNQLFEQAKARTEDIESITYEQLTSPEVVALEGQFNQRVRTALDMTVEIRKVLLNAKVRLDEDAFDDEIQILNNYIKTLGGELEFGDEQMEQTMVQTEMYPAYGAQSLDQQLQLLFREVVLDLQQVSGGKLAVSGFSHNDGQDSALIALLNEKAVSDLTGLEQLRILERSKLEAVLNEQELALSDLVDTENAIQIGRIMAADLLLTGTVIEMTQSVIIFSRIIDVVSGEIESAAQVIVPKSADLERLLSI
jgi:Ca-activated chloride channel family protein